MLIILKKYIFFLLGILFVFSTELEGLKCYQTKTNEMGSEIHVADSAIKVECSPISAGCLKVIIFTGYHNKEKRCIQRLSCGPDKKSDKWTYNESWNNCTDATIPYHRKICSCDKDFCNDDELGKDEKTKQACHDNI